MKRAFLIHGSYGDPDENWFPWLKKELEKEGYEVITPHFPTPENQSLDSWMEVFESHKHTIDESSIVIGHSLGPAFLLHVLEELSVKIKAAFFVAGFCSQLGLEDFDTINATFVEHEFDWEQIRSTANYFSVIHSDNDPYVPVKFAEEIAQNLHTKVEIVSEAGHFNASAGYTDFPLLLEKILNF